MTKHARGFVKEAAATDAAATDAAALTKQRGRVSRVSQLKAAAAAQAKAMAKCGYGDIDIVKAKSRS